MFKPRPAEARSAGMPSSNCCTARSSTAILRVRRHSGCRIGIVSGLQKDQHSFVQRGAFVIRVHQQLRMCSCQFGADNLNRWLQAPELQFNIEVVVAKPIFGTSASEPSHEGCLPKAVEVAVR